jgi:hypothetical protein
MAIAQIDVEKAMEVAATIKGIIDGEKHHTVLAALTLTIANMGVDSGASFDDLISDMDTIRHTYLQRGE